MDKSSTQDKTRQLLQELEVIERKSHAMRLETERLRKMKDEAKDRLAVRYPDLFSKYTCSKQSPDISSK
jgi:hypothetical protein